MISGERTEEIQQPEGPPSDRDIEAQVRRRTLEKMPRFSNSTLLLIEDLLQASSPNLDGVRHLIEDLYNQLNEERRLTPKRAGALDAARNSGTPTSMLQKILELKKELIPLQIPLIAEYVERAKVAAEEIKGKDVVLLIGVTGAGKSTTIQYLYGTKMGKIRRNGIEYIGPAQEVQGPAANVTISPEAKSETRYITAIPLNRENTGISKFDVHLCDSPGFSDTQGAEIDISNMIGVSHALQGCKTLT